MAPWATSVGRDRRIAPQSLHNEIALSGDCGDLIEVALPMGSGAGHGGVIDPALPRGTLFTGGAVKRDDVGPFAGRGD